MEPANQNQSQTARKYLIDKGIEISLDDYRPIAEIARAFGHVPLVGANLPPVPTTPDKTEV